MRQRRGLRSALISAAAGVACLALATPAWANSTVPLHQTDVTASGYSQECGDDRFDGKTADQDGWHFVLPGADAGSFVDLTLKFTDLGGNAVTINIPDAGDAYPDAFYKAGDETIHAYLFTPAGWTLNSGTATITGTTEFFNLSHTCAGTSPSTPPSTPPTTPPGTPPTTPPTTETPGTPGGGDNGDDEGGSLPVTGAAAGGIALAGLALIGGGTALVVIRRRRNITFTA